jgi:hypothetical protein
MAKAAGKSIARFKCSRCFIASPVMRLPSYREDKFCLADVFRRLTYQPSIGSLFHPARLVRAGIGNSAFPTRHRARRGREAGAPATFHARAVIDGVRDVTRFTLFKT